MQVVGNPSKCTTQDEKGLIITDAFPSHGGETQVRVSQSQVAELGLGSTLPASNSRKG